MAGKGGKRPGAGRPKGSRNARTKAVIKLVDRALKADATPLEVMLKAMNDALERNDLPAAHAFAKDAAPYVHPRLAAVAHSGSLIVNPAEVSDAELAAIARGSRAGIAAAESPSKVTH